MDHCIKNEGSPLLAQNEVRADGLKSGLQMGMQKKEMKWKTKQLEELDKVFEQWIIFADCSPQPQKNPFSLSPF